MRPIEDLISAHQEGWTAVTGHAFCAELADGTLSTEKMAWYLIQDYTFIGNFVRLAASAVAHAPSLADSIPLAQFLAVITGPENTYFQRSFEALNVSEQDRTAPTLAPATQGFQELMAEAAKSGSYLSMISVLVVAESTYLGWATPVNPPRDDLPFYFAEWITLHAGDGFEAVVAYLQDQFDKAWIAADEAERADAEACFARAVMLEEAFFDAAYAAS